MWSEWSGLYFKASDLDPAFSTTFLQDLITLQLLRNITYFFLNLEEINYQVLAMTSYSIDRTLPVTLCYTDGSTPTAVVCTGIRLSGRKPQGQIYFPT